MAISLDNAPASRSLVFGVDTLTFSFTRAAGPGVLIIAAARNVNGGSSIISVTYGGEAATLVGSQGITAGVYAMYRLDNPASSGANNIVITLSTLESVILGNAVSFSGDPAIAAFNSNVQVGTGITFLDNALTVGDQSWIALIAGSSNFDLTGGTNVTNNSTSNPLVGWFGPRSGAGSTTLRVNDAVSDDILSITVEIAPAAAAGGQPTMRRWGGVPHMGGQSSGRHGSGRMWGRTRSGLMVPRRFQEAA